MLRECEIKLELTTGSVIHYRYEIDEGVHNITRTLETPEGKNTVKTSITDIQKDGEALMNVARQFRVWGR